MKKRGTSGSYAHVGERMGGLGMGAERQTGQLQAPSGVPQANKLRGSKAGSGTYPATGGGAPKGMKTQRGGDDY